MGFPRHRKKLFLVEVKIRALPVVEKDRTGLISPLSACQACPVEVVVRPAHPAESLVRVDEDRFRRRKALPPAKLPGEVLRIDAEKDTRHVEGRHLDLLEMVPAVHQRKTVDLPVLLRCAGPHEGDKRILLRSAGRSGKALNCLDPAFQPARVGMALPSPRSGQLQHLIVHIEELDAGRERFQERDRLLPVLGKTAVAGDDRIIAEQRIGQREVCPAHLIGEGDLKRFRLIFRLRVRRRQAGKRRLSRKDLIPPELEVRHTAPVRLKDLACGGAVITGAEERVLLAHIVQGEVGRVRHGERHLRSPRRLMKVREILSVVDPFSVIQIFQLIVLHHIEDIADIFIGKMKYF